MIGNARIVNKTSIGNDTEIYVDDVKLKGVQTITIHPIKKYDIITATVTLIVSELDLIVVEKEEINVS